MQIGSRVLLGLVLLAAAGTAFGASRSEAVQWLADPAFGVVQPADFETLTNESGKRVARANLLEQDGILAGVVGPKGDIDEITVIVKFREDNFRTMTMWLASLSGRALPGMEDEATQWMVDTISELGENNGGARTVNDSGNRVRMELNPAGIGIYNVKFDQD